MTVLGDRRTGSNPLITRSTHQPDGVPKRASGARKLPDSAILESVKPNKGDRKSSFNLKSAKGPKISDCPVKEFQKTATFSGVFQFIPKGKGVFRGAQDGLLGGPRVFGIWAISRFRRGDILQGIGQGQDSPYPISKLGNRFGFWKI